MKIKILAGAFLFSVLAGGFILGSFLSGSKKGELSIDGRNFKIETASSQKDMEKGLGGRKKICENCGMLFVFPQKGRHSFWMKDMNFDLDIIWISKGKIVYMAKNVSKDYAETISPEVEADEVLEIAAGIGDRYGFAVGDSVVK